MTPEIRALQDELHERLAAAVDHQQSPEDTQRDWVDIRRAYGHLVGRANAVDLPLMDAVPFRMRPTITLAEALQAMVTTTPEPGLTVTDEVHVTTDEQLARVAQSAADTSPGPLLAGEAGCDFVAPPARPAETEPAGEIVVNIEPNLEAFHTKLAAELAQPAWRHPFLVTRDKIEQAFRELFR